VTDEGFKEGEPALKGDPLKILIPEKLPGMVCKLPDVSLVSLFGREEIDPGFIFQELEEQFCLANPPSSIQDQALCVIGSIPVF
jgi:hypothetical protein